MRKVTKLLIIEQIEQAIKELRGCGIECYFNGNVILTVRWAN